MKTSASVASRVWIVCTSQLAEHLMERGIVGEAVERKVRVSRAVAGIGTRLAPSVRRAASFSARGESMQAMRPSTMNATRSHNSSAAAMSCVVRKTVAPPLPLGPNEVLDALHVHRVEPARRLVQKYQVRVVQQATGDAQTALHALRVLADAPVAVALEPDRFEQRRGGPRRSVIQRREIAQVLQAGELEEVVGRLEGDADPLVVVGRSRPRPPCRARARRRW